MESVPDLQHIMSSSSKKTEPVLPNYVSPKPSPLLLGGQGSFQQSSDQNFRLGAPLIQKPHVDNLLTASNYERAHFSCGPLHLPPMLPNLSFASFERLAFESNQDESPQRIKSSTTVSDCDEINSRVPQWRNQKLNSCAVPSLTSLGRAISYPALFEDDELDTFLGEIDLSFELEKAEDMLKIAIV